MKDIRVAHCGNMANNAYIYVKQLRRKGYNVDLVMDFGEHVMSYPQWEDGDFELSGIRTATEGLMLDDVIKIIGKDKWGELPEWVRFIGKGVRRRMKDPSIILNDLKGYGAKDIYKHSRTSSLKDPFLTLDWIKIMKEYDVLHTWGRPTAFAPNAGTPYVATPIGADLLGACGKTPLTMPSKEMYINGFRESKKIIFHDPGFFDMTKELGFDQGVLIPFPVDVEKYKPAESELREQLLKRCSCEMILYNPARQDWFWKGSDKMIKAFARFVKEDNYRAHLLLAEWGKNIEDSRKLINELGISKHVSFLPAFGKSRLVKHYNACDVVLDTFNHTDFAFHAFGTSTLEALACGKPVVTDFHPEELTEYYPGEVPLRSAKREEQIYERLRELNDENARKEVGKKSRDWILKFFNGPMLVERFMEIYERSLT